MPYRKYLFLLIFNQEPQGKAATSTTGLRLGASKYCRNELPSPHLSNRLDFRCEVPYAADMALELACLGTADALGSGGRHCAGYRVRNNETQILLEAGPSILTQLKARQQDMAALDGVALSHLHGDHFAGLPFLLLEYEHQTRRDRPFIVLGPPGTETRVRRLLDTLYWESRGRRFSFPLHFVDMVAGSETEVGSFRLSSFEVPHQETEISLGYRLCGDDQSLVFSGDTPWTEDLLRESENADLFLCECTDLQESSGHHIRYTDIERHRRSFGCGELLLTHLGPEVQARADELPEHTATDSLVVHLGTPLIAQSR